MRTAKAWVGFVGSVATAFSAALSDDVFSATDKQQVALTIVAALATLYAVYRVPNRDS